MIHSLATSIYFGFPCSSLRLMLFCICGLLVSCNSGNPSPDEKFCGVWSQNNYGQEPCMYLEFTRDNTLKVYAEYPEEECLITLMANESSMPFRKIGSNQLVFTIMGTVSRMTYRIAGDTLFFIFDEQTRSALGHGAFLTDSYRWRSKTMDRCTKTPQEWQQEKQYQLTGADDPPVSSRFFQ